jgi:transposase
VGHSIKDGAQAIGRSRGGLTTKIHVLIDALGNPVEVMLSPGQDHDLTCAELLIEAVDPGSLIADKAFDGCRRRSASGKACSS